MLSSCNYALQFDTYFERFTFDILRKYICSVGLARWVLYLPLAQAQLFAFTIFQPIKIIVTSGERLYEALSSLCIYNQILFNHKDVADFVSRDQNWSWNPLTAATTVNCSQTLIYKSILIRSSVILHCAYVVTIVQWVRP